MSSFRKDFTWNCLRIDSYQPDSLGGLDYTSGQNEVNQSIPKQAYSWEPFSGISIIVKDLKVQLFVYTPQKQLLLTSHTILTPEAPWAVTLGSGNFVERCLVLRDTTAPGTICVRHEGGMEEVGAITLADLWGWWGTGSGSQTGCTGVGCQQLMTANCEPYVQTLWRTYVQFIAWNQSQWEYLHHRNWWTLQIRAFFIHREPVVKHLPVYQQSQDNAFFFHLDL